MSLASFHRSSVVKYVAFGIVAIMLGVITSIGPHSAAAQEPAGGDQVSRGRYIVENVAMCGNCHTPRLPNGELDRTHWLQGASNPYLPAQPSSNWPINAPRLAGTPPATDAGMVTLLTTAVWIDGRTLHDPMPHFHMTRSDAEAVVAYLKSLR